MNFAATESEPQSYVAAFMQSLRQAGWIEGQNIHVEIRWNAGDAQLAKIYAAQIVGIQPDAILAASTTNLNLVRQATTTVPIVFAMVSDPVAQGFVASLTRPGSNITGFSLYEFAIGGKWLDLLKEASPGLTRVGVVFNPDTAPQTRFFMRSIETAAAKLGVQALTLPVRKTEEIEPALEAFARQPGGGLILPTDSFTRLHQQFIADVAIRHRLPAISQGGDFAKDGGLMVYNANVNLNDHFRQAAGYIDRILKGTKPGDLPVQQAAKYRLVINLKTAKALGLTIPLPLTGLADEVIE